MLLGKVYCSPSVVGTNVGVHVIDIALLSILYPSKFISFSSTLFPSISNAYIIPFPATLGYGAPSSQFLKCFLSSILSELKYTGLATHIVVPSVATAAFFRMVENTSKSS